MSDIWDRIEKAGSKGLHWWWREYGTSAPLEAGLIEAAQRGREQEQRIAELEAEDAQQHVAYLDLRKERDALKTENHRLRAEPTYKIRQEQAEEIERLREALADMKCSRCNGTGQVKTPIRTGFSLQDGDPEYTTRIEHCPQCIARNELLKDNEGRGDG